MTPRLFRRMAIGVGAASAIALGALAIALIRYGTLDALFLLGPVGGAAFAIVLAALNARRAPVTVPDPFARDAALFDVINIAHVRIAGVGGLGLMIVAAVVVLQFQLLTAAYVLGIVGGICCGLSLIYYRRTLRLVRPSQAFEHL